MSEELTTTLNRLYCGVPVTLASLFVPAQSFDMEDSATIFAYLDNEVTCDSSSLVTIAKIELENIQQSTFTLRINISHS